MHGLSGRAPKRDERRGVSRNITMRLYIRLIAANPTKINLG